MVKLILKYLLFGIAVGCFFFIGNIIFLDLMGSDRLQVFFDNFTSHAIGFMIVGVGFFGGSFLYEIENLKFSSKVIIHITLGISLFIIVGFINSWISLENRSDLIINIIANVAILLAVWTALYIQDRKEIQRVNRALKERDLMKPLDTE